MFVTAVSHQDKHQETSYHQRFLSSQWVVHYVWHSEQTLNNAGAVRSPSEIFTSMCFSIPPRMDLTAPLIVDLFLC